MVALNAKTGNVDGSKRWLRSDDDSERQTEDSDDDDSERQTENSGKDSERRNRGCNSEYRSENRQWLWTPKLKSNDDDHERQTEKW